MDSQRKKNLLFIFVIALLLYGIVSAIYDGSVEAQTECENTVVKGVLRNLIYNYLSYGETFEGTNITLTTIKGLLTLYKANILLERFSCLTYKPIITEAENLSLKQPKCNDGTYYGECSPTKPMYCYAGNFVPRCQLCGCKNVNYTCFTDGNCKSNETFTCSDGTIYQQCSTTKPKYCQDGTLTDNCQVCGCESGQTCQENGTCICSDGTIYQQCSTTKPKYCNKEGLINNCQVCGCPEGKICKDDGSCPGVK